MERKMYQPKYDYKFIIQDLKEHNDEIKSIKAGIKVTYKSIFEKLGRLLKDMYSRSESNSR